MRTAKRVIREAAMEAADVALSMSARLLVYGGESPDDPDAPVTDQPLILQADLERRGDFLVAKSCETKGPGVPTWYRILGHGDCPVMDGKASDLGLICNGAEIKVSVE